MIEPDKNKALELHKSSRPLNLKCGVASMRGYRPYMEDRYCIDLKVKSTFPLAFAGIFDGHGGDFIVDSVHQKLLSVIQEQSSWNETQSKNHCNVC